METERAMSKKKKCRPCDGQGMLLRALQPEVGAEIHMLAVSSAGTQLVRVPCHHCDGTGKPK